MNNHIAKQIAVERQRELRSSARGGEWRISDLFRMFRRSSELETVPSRRADAVGADGRPRAFGQPSLTGR